LYTNLCYPTWVLICSRILKLILVLWTGISWETQYRVIIISLAVNLRTTLIGCTHRVFKILNGHFRLKLIIIITSCTTATVGACLFLFHLKMILVLFIFLVILFWVISVSWTRTSFFKLPLITIKHVVAVITWEFFHLLGV